MTNVSAVALRRAADVADKIESLNKELSAILGGFEVGNGLKASTSDGRKSRKGRKRGPMSAAAKAKIAAAARARWAKAKAAGKKRL